MVANVSERRRLTQVVVAVLFNLTCAGVIFGFAALKPVLIKKGVYSELCDSDDKPSYDRPCNEQDLRLNFMFTLSTMVTNIAALPIGAIMDRIGPRATTIVGSVIFATGNLIFPLGFVTKSVDTYFCGYILLAIGGPLMFLPSFHLSNTFPLQSGLILSCITGAFDASSIPYLLYNIMDAKLGGISLKTFFWSYSIIPAMQLAWQLCAAPANAYQRHDFLEPKSTGNHSRDSSVATTSDGVSPTVVGDLEGEYPKGAEESGDRIIGVMFEKSAREQILSTWFAAIVFFLCIYMARINYLIQTIYSQLSFYLGDLDQARSMTTTFTILLPLGGIVGIPFVGWLLDRRTTFDGSNAILLMGATFGVLGMIPHVIPQVISIGIFVILRPLMYTFVGDYCGKVFGFNTFGTVYGLANATSGAFGIVLRAVDLWVKYGLQGNYTPVNIVGLVLGVVGSGALSLKIWLGTRGVTLE